MYVFDINFTHSQVTIALLLSNIKDTWLFLMEEPEFIYLFFKITKSVIL